MRPNFRVDFFSKKIYRDFSLEIFSKDFPCFFEKKFKGIFLQKNFVKRFPCKFTPWLVLHVLHFIGDFFYKTRASLARAAFNRNFITKSVTLLKRGSFRVLSRPRYRPPTQLVVDSSGYEYDSTKVNREK